MASLSPAQLDRIYDAGRLDLGSGDRYPELAAHASAYVKAATAACIHHDAQGFRVTSIGIGRSHEGPGSFLSAGFTYEGDALVGCQSTVLEVGPPPDYRDWWDTDDMRASRSRADPTVEAAKPIEGKSFDDLLDKASAVLGFSYVAESYRDSSPGGHTFYPVRGRRISASLNRLVSGPRTWWRSGSTYLVQHTRWWEDRQAEIPDEVWEKVKGRVKSGLRSLEDWSELAVLTDKQWRWLQSLREMGTEKEWLPELALYRSLSASDRLAAFGSGLWAGPANPNARSAVLAWARKRLAAEDASPGGFADVCIQLRVSGATTDFAGLGSMPDGSRPAVVRRSLPLLPRSALPPDSVPKPKASGPGI